MQHETLTSFLNGERSANDFWSEIGPEVHECIAACANNRVGAVIITAGPLFKISPAHVTVLIVALSSGMLPMSAASYIADALIMSDDFDWNAGGVADAIFRLSDEIAPLTQNDLDWVADRIALGS